MGIKTNGFVKGCLSEELKKLIRSVASGYGDVVDLEQLEIVPLKGAMTNEVFQITWPTTDGDLSRKVLVRVYGEGVEVFFNREDEIRTFETISKHGQGPRLLGRFGDGRIEEFIHARTLSAADLRDPEISALIAAKLREFHTLDMPFSKNVHLWDTLRKWLATGKTLCSLKDSKDFSLDTLEDEITLLEKELPHESQEIGFCHNDLQYGNIMMDEETRSITIIDYEYSSYNPVAYDIANHFCEMVADYHSETPHVLDYSKYPDLEERKRFVRIYLSYAGNQPSDGEVKQLLDDVEKYTLANHLFWGLWGLISGYVNKIDFDYMEYAKQRFEQYRLRKQQLLGSSAAKPPAEEGFYRVYLLEDWEQRRRLACHRFSGPKDEDLTIAGRLLGVEVTAGLGGLYFGEMEEGKGRDFDYTFRLSTLAMVVIFLPADFLVLVDFHFVLICLCVGVITASHTQI